LSVAVAWALCWLIVDLTVFTALTHSANVL
jgi:hypothetical protein